MLQKNYFIGVRKILCTTFQTINTFPGMLTYWCFESLSFLEYFYIAAVHEIPERSGIDGMDTLETIPDAVPTVFTEPPIEDQLAWHTLWPESHKLYGHGNELFSLCCDHKGELVASSCKV